MFRATASFVALAMLLWVMPLGSFIKPSQEATACGGGRAFHMCCMLSGKVHPASDSGKISFTSATSVDKTQKSAGSSAGNDFTDALMPPKVYNNVSRLAELGFSLPLKNPYFTIDPVPKA